MTRQSALTLARDALTWARTHVASRNVGTQKIDEALAAIEAEFARDHRLAAQALGTTSATKEG